MQKRFPGSLCVSGERPSDLWKPTAHRNALYNLRSPKLNPTGRFTEDVDPGARRDRDTWIALVFRLLPQERFRAWLTAHGLEPLADADDAEARLPEW